MSEIPGHQVTRSPSHQVTKSPSHQVTSKRFTGDTVNKAAIMRRNYG